MRWRVLGRKISDGEYAEKIRDLVNQGYNQEEIGKIIHRKHEYVSQVMTLYEISPRPIEKEKSKATEKLKKDWDVVTYALKGLISKKVARAYCRKKITYAQAMKGIKKHEETVG